MGGARVYHTHVHIITPEGFTEMVVIEDLVPVHARSAGTNSFNI